MSIQIKDGNELVYNQGTMHEDFDPRILVLASKVYELALSKIVAHNRFLASPLSQVEVEYKNFKSRSPFMTEGDKLYIHPYRFLSTFEKTEIPPESELIHIILHFLLIHPFVGPDIDEGLWNLACDIAVENLVLEIVPHNENERHYEKVNALKQIAEEIDKTLTAEVLYKLLKEGMFSDRLSYFEDLFYCDDHSLWYERKIGQGDEGSQSRQSPLSKDNTSQETSSSRAPQQMSSDDEDDENDVSEDFASIPSEKEASFTQEEIDKIEEKWQKAAKSMKVDLETLSRASGKRLSGLLKELEISTHKEVDYKEFLRQFAVKNEDVRLSDDEFDYIFYTYGLELYEDMPLIEPLEYRTNNEIKDFCIVIDTSSSVTGTVVQEFINTTFDVLASENTFAQKVNIHIIQCDNAVQSDTKITSVSEIREWARSFKLRGFGGTDFRPAFKYINELYHAGEFNDLSGVIYFTDGWGIYPDRMPPYKTAFCFYDEDNRPELVPPWAIQLVLHPGQLDSKSVYS